MPNFGTLVLGPPEFRRFSAEIRFAEYRRSRIRIPSILTRLRVDLVD